MKIIPISIVIPFRQEQESSPGALYVWTQTRESSDELKGLKEFPGGKIEPSETPSQAAIRELREETGVELAEESLVPFNTYNYSYPSKTVRLYVFLCETNSKTFSNAGWVELIDSSWKEDLEGKTPDANYRILEDIIKFFKTNL